MKLAKTFVSIAAIALALFALNLSFGASAAENELELTYKIVSCTEAQVTVNWNDIVDEAGDKVLRVFVGDASADVHQLEDAFGVDDDESFVYEVAPGTTVRATLRTGPGPEGLLDEDTITVPAQECDDASITVRKVVAGVSNDTTNFNVDFSAGVADIVGIDENDAPVRRGELTPGLYILTEYSIPSGYQFVDWVCESDQLGADIDTDNAALEVAINLRASEDIFCVLTNEPKPPTATPTATATTTPTATATTVSSTTSTSIPAVVATVEPVQSITNIFNQIQAPPAATPVAQSVAPAIAPAVSLSGTIKPPNTGTGGLLN